MHPVVCLQVNQQGGDGIGDGGAAGVENAIRAFAHSLDTKMFGEFGGVSALHLYKVDGVVLQEAMEFAQLDLGLFAVFVGGVVRVPRDQADGLVCAFGKERLGLGIEFNAGDAQLGGAEGPGNQGHENHGEDEDAGDLEPLGPLVDIHQRGVDEDEGYEAESERERASVRAAMVTAQEAEVIRTRTPVA